MIIAAVKIDHDYFCREEHCVKSVRIRSHSSPHFPAFLYTPYSPNAGKCGKMKTRITPNTDTFHVVEQSLARKAYVVFFATFLI